MSHYRYVLIALLPAFVACSDINSATDIKAQTTIDTIHNVDDAAPVSDSNDTGQFMISDNQADPGNPSEIQSELADESTLLEPIVANSPADAPSAEPPTSTVFAALATDIQDRPDIYRNDGYATVDVIRVDIRTHTEQGECDKSDTSGCTFADVLADTDGSDSFVAEIPVHFSSEEFSPSSAEPNASLRQRGATSRFAVQKSFRIKLDSKDTLWRGERRLQLNKHPYDQSRIQNKLSFDLMQALPHLPSLRTQFVNLWIDDGAGPVDHGLYTHVEAVVKEYLTKRDHDKDDNLYKANNFYFSNTDLSYLTIDESGQPTDIERFESRLEIKRGDDHGKLIEMLVALNDPNRSFSSVMDKYFNRNNVLMWATVNFLLGQHDVTSQNFYLYNAAGTDTFYFLPWDYDATFQQESELVNGFDSDSLRERLLFGYARFIDSKFMSQYLREPGAHQNILLAASEVRAAYLTDDAIAFRIQQYVDQVRPFLMRSPDLENIAGVRELQFFDVYDRLIEAMPGVVAINHQRLQNDFAIPLPPFVKLPLVSRDQLVLQWLPAYDVTGNAVIYDIDVSSSPLFEPDSVVLHVEGIADQPQLVQYSIDRNRLNSGQWYLRVIARSVLDPDRFWTVAHNELPNADQTLYGLRAFSVP